MKIIRCDKIAFEMRTPAQIDVLIAEWVELWKQVHHG
jgi:hypothetical protein